MSTEAIDNITPLKRTLNYDLLYNHCTYMIRRRGSCEKTICGKRCIEDVCYSHKPSTLIIRNELSKKCKKENPATAAKIKDYQREYSKLHQRKIRQQYKIYRENESKNQNA